MTITMQRIASWSSALLFAWAINDSTLHAQTDPKGMNVPVAPQVSIDMVLVPPGKILRTPPTKASDIDDKSSKNGATVLPGLSTTIDVPSFYISTTEVTFAQLGAILDSDRVAAIQKRIVETSGTDPQNQYLREAIKSPDLPGFSLSLDDVMSFCALLTKQAQQSQAGSPTSIETRRFRIPSHLEWQYACRAMSDPHQITKFPHFNRWVDLDAMPKESRAKIIEEWQKLGKPNNELTGGQTQIFELIDKRMAQADALGAPQQILTDYFREALGVNRNFLAGSSRLYPVRRSKPNAWGIFDMHDNVCEWVLKIDDRNEFLAFWNKLESPASRKDAQILARPCLLLAGGGFSQTATQAGAWKDFSIWGAYPMNRASDELTPRTIEDGLDNSSRGLAADLNPGLRLVMDRTLRGDWFAVIRIAAKAQVEKARFEDFRHSAEEVASANEAMNVKAYADLYEGLSLIRGGKRSEGGEKLATGFSVLAKQGPTQQAKGSKLDELRKQMAGKSTAHKTQQTPGITDDALFFSLASEIAH